MDTTGFKVKMMRTNIDPNIPPKPRKAFSLEEGPHKFQGTMTRTKDGVFLSVPVEKGTRYFEVFSANIECIEYFPQEAEVKRGKKTDA